MSYAIEESNNRFIIRQEVVCPEHQSLLHLTVESIYDEVVRATAYEYENTHEPWGQFNEFYQDQIEEEVNKWVMNASEEEMTLIIKDFGGYDETYESYCDESIATGRRLGRIQNLTATLAQHAVQHKVRDLEFKDLICLMIEERKVDWDIVLKAPRGEGESEEEGEAEDN